MEPVRVLYDGWALVYAPSSPAALHLAAILSELHTCLETSQIVHPVLALPGAVRQASLAAFLTEIGIQTVGAPLQPGPSWQRDTDEVDPLRWQQYTLFILARQEQANLTHLVTSTPPLVGGPRTIISPTEPMDGWPASGRQQSNDRTNRYTSFRNRLADALAQGGLARSRGLLIPYKFPPPAGFIPEQIPVSRLPPLVLKSKSTQDTRSDLGLPDDFILCHARTENALWLALKAWSWAADSIGQDCPLVLAELGGNERKQALFICQEIKLNPASIVFLPEMDPLALAGLFALATLVFLPGSATAWGDSAWHGMANGKALVSCNFPWNDAIVGNAGILAPARDSRGLGAALIQCIVQEEVRAGLEEAARKRAATWTEGAGFGEELVKIYRSMMG